MDPHRPRAYRVRRSQPADRSDAPSGTASETLQVLKSLEQGQTVGFAAERGQKGMQAAEVRRESAGERGPGEAVGMFDAPPVATVSPHTGAAVPESEVRAAADAA
ncbi:hypothetical protein [Streptomyces avidinii]